MSVSIGAITSPSTNVARDTHRVSGNRTGDEPPLRPSDPAIYFDHRLRVTPANDNKQPLGVMIERFSLVLIGALLLVSLAWIGFS